jgi:hypothetical protein
MGDVDWIRAIHPRTAFVTTAGWVWPVSVVFCDGQPPPFVCKPAGLEMLFHQKTQRRTAGNFRTHLVQLNHCALGGLTLLNQVLLCATAAHPA